MNSDNAYSDFGEGFANKLDFESLGTTFNTTGLEGEYVPRSVSKVGGDGFLGGSG